MASIKITDVVGETLLVEGLSDVEELSDLELHAVVGGNHITVVSCNTDGTYTYTDGKNTWKAKPWWKWW